MQTGSVLIEMGNTRVICTATIDEKVPPFIKGTGKRMDNQRIWNAPRVNSGKESQGIIRGRPRGPYAGDPEVDRPFVALCNQYGSFGGKDHMD